MQRIIFLLAAAVFTLSGNAFADGKKIVKWVDNNGVTHYGDKLPAQEAGLNNAPVNKADVADQQKLELERKDKILLASYTKAEEIDLARDRNLQMDLATVQSLEQQKLSAANRTARNNKTADSFKARQKPVPPYLVEELKLSKLESASIDKQLANRKLAMEATKARYAEEKTRFIALKQPTAIDSIAGSLDTVIAENPTAAGAQTTEPTAKK
jgi:Domain of unknown function (DUF4124)